MRLCDLKRKEVINVRTCSSMGFVSDLEIDIRTGCILSVIVPGSGKLCWFTGRETEYVIPWNCITQIGPDILLVDVDEEKLRRKCG